MGKLLGSLGYCHLRTLPELLMWIICHLFGAFDPVARPAPAGSGLAARRGCGQPQSIPDESVQVGRHIALSKFNR
jgi:hypothetical protein